MQTGAVTADLVADGYDVGAIFLIATHALRRSARPESTTGDPRWLGQRGPSLTLALGPAIEQFERLLERLPVGERERLETAVGELEKTHVRPVLDAEGTAQAIERANALAPGYFEFLSKHFNALFQWLDAADNREAFLAALQTLRLDALLPDGGPRAVAHARQCLTLMGHHVGLLRWLFKATKVPDPAYLERFLRVSSLADIFGQAILFGISEDATSERPTFASLASTARDYLLERYALTLQLVRHGLADDVRAAFEAELLQRASERRERLAAGGVQVSCEPACAIFVGDPVLGEYLEKVLRVAAAHLGGATIELALLSHPEMAEDRLAVRVTAGPSMTVDAALEAQTRVRQTIRTLLPPEIASFLSLDVRLP